MCTDVRMLRGASDGLRVLGSGPDPFSLPGTLRITSTIRPGPLQARPGALKITNTIRPGLLKEGLVLAQDHQRARVQFAKDPSKTDQKH